eukprot:scaffold65349_cov35-Tisochrysis_lutea.AAC.1
MSAVDQIETYDAASDTWTTAGSSQSLRGHGARLIVYDSSVVGALAGAGSALPRMGPSAFVLNLPICRDSECCAPSHSRLSSDRKEADPHIENRWDAAEYATSKPLDTLLPTHPHMCRFHTQASELYSNPTKPHP